MRALPSKYNIHTPFSMAFFSEPFEFIFMQRALLGVLLLSLGATPIGVFLMLRRMSLTGDAMAHAILPGAAMGYWLYGFSLAAMTLGGLIAGVCVALLSGLVARGTVLKEDATLATFYIVSLAFGVILVSLRGSNVDVLHVLFGNVLALDNAALGLLASIAALTLTVLLLTFRLLILECVDPTFFRTISRLGAPIHLLFLVLVVLNLVGAFHALGTLMAVGIMVLPVTTARLWTARIGSLLALSVSVAFISGISGLLLSYHAGLPASPSLIVCAGMLYLVSLIFGTESGLFWRFWPQQHRAH
jgi:zinc/manganese transport system permease protein